MRKNIIRNIVIDTLFLLMLLSEALAIGAIIRLDMLPRTLLIALICLFALFTLLIGVMIFAKGKGKGKVRRLIASVLAVLILCGCGAITVVASDVLKTLEMTRQEYEGVPVRAVYVLKDNPVETLENTAGYTYGYVKNYDESCTQQALDAVLQRTGGQISTAGYINAFAMAQALLENRIDAIVLNGGYISILEDSEAFADFSQKIKVLTLIEVDESVEMVEDETPPSQEEVPEVTEDYTAIEPEQLTFGQVDYDALTPFAVYVSGSDSYDDKIVMKSRSDVNILAVVNPMTKQILLINTPRDYYVPNPAVGGKMDKLTHCGIYGINCSMKTLGKLYEAQIDYYVRINFTGFKQLIDALGGVTVYSDYAFTAITRTPIKEGENHLDGQQALDFARERYTLKGGDNERGKHQMQVITAVIEKATSGSTIIANYSDIMDSVEGMFSMNIPADMISNMMKLQLSDMAKWNIISYSATGYGSMEECGSMPGMELSVIKPRQSSVNKAIRLIDMVWSGELLTEEVVNSIL